MIFQKKAAVDLDDSSLDFIPQFILFHNFFYGTSLTKEDFKTYDFCEICKCPKMEMDRRMIEFADSKYASQIIPAPGARLALKFLKEIDWSMIVVTGRGNHLKKMTALSVKTHFDGFFSGIYHAKGYAPGLAKPKSQICREQGVSIIFDDDPVHIIDCANAGIKVIVRDQPWNQGSLPQGAYRMVSFYEVPRIMYELNK